MEPAQNNGLTLLKNKAKIFLTNSKGKNIILVLGMVGIALIFFSSSCKSTGKKNREDIGVSKNYTEDYVHKLEENLKGIVCNINGAGDAKVLVTLESSVQTVYATEQRKNKEATEDKSGEENSKKRETDDLETKYIKIKDANGAEKALSVTELQPAIKGVVVVCGGGDDLQVQKKVTEAVKTALNISSKRVFVTK